MEKLYKTYQIGMLKEQKFVELHIKLNFQNG